MSRWEVDREVSSRDEISRERKEELREAALIFESVIRESPLAIDIFGPDENVLIWNPAAERLLGWSEEEVLGKPLPTVPEETRREIDIVHAATLAGDSFIGVETRLQRKDGELIDISLSTAPFYDAEGRISGAMAVLVDISERKRAEEVLGFLSRISTEITKSLTVLPILNRLAELMLPILGDFVAIDLRGEGGELRRVASLHVDPAMADVVAELQRYPPIEPNWDRDTARSDQQPTILYEVADNWFVYSSSSVDHLRLLRRLAPRSILTVPLTARGQPLGTITLALTNPGRRYELRDLELAREVARRASIAVENAQLFERTEEAVKARDEVMAIVSHDLRNPINTITMTTDLLRDQLPEGEPRHLLDTISRSTERLERLIRDLLDVSTIEAGGLTIERAPVDPAELVREAVQLHETAAHENGITLTAEVEEDGLPTLEADRGRLLQVFQNLIENALKFTPEGGRITVGAEEEPGAVRFMVSDTGPGVDPEQLPHLFDRFWQARKGLGGGAGLGLAIARGIVEAHGGEIMAESTPGRGTTIIFTIPVG